jgi:hypothetical protein
MSDALDNTQAINVDAAGEAIAITHDDGRLLKRDLIERVKELNCLYGISRLMENRDYTVDQILKCVADLIPRAWQYPEVAGARITVNKQRFQTNNFHETLWEQEEAIIVNGKEVGSLEVCYLREKPPAYEGPFLKEEKILIHVLAGYAFDHWSGDAFGTENVLIVKIDSNKRMVANFKSTSPPVPKITIEDVKSILDAGENIILLDVRPKADFDKSHIPDAISIPVADLADRYIEIPQGPQILVYSQCQ